MSRTGHWDVFVSVLDEPILSCGVCMCKLTRSRARAFALTKAYRDKFSCANSENPKHNVDCRRDSPHCTQQWLRRGPGCMAAHNETYQKPIVETSDPSISDDSKTPVGSDFLSSCGFERKEKRFNKKLTKFLSYPFFSDSLIHNTR